MDWNSRYARQQIAVLGARVSVGDLNVLPARSVARHVHALSNFWQYLLDLEVVEHDPLRCVSVPKLPKRLPIYPNEDELRAILAATQRQRLAFCAFLDRAMMVVLIFTGVRRSELLGLIVGDVDLAQKTMRVEHGKGRKTRVIPMVDESVGAVGDWLEFRPLASTTAC